jgi:hypothetical protein
MIELISSSKHGLLKDIADYQRLFFNKVTSLLEPYIPRATGMDISIIPTQPEYLRGMR